MLDLGDVEGLLVWRRVLDAVKERVRIERRPGEPLS
jgi:hypothetical protein